MAAVFESHVAHIESIFTRPRQTKNGKMATCTSQSMNHVWRWSRSNSPLAPESDDGPVTLFVSLLLDLGAERNGTHNAVAKLFVQDGLVSVAVVLDNLVEPVDQRLPGGHFHLPSTVRVAGKLLFQKRMVDI